MSLEGRVLLVTAAILDKRHDNKNKEEDKAKEDSKHMTDFRQGSPQILKVVAHVGEEIDREPNTEENGPSDVFNISPADSENQPKGNIDKCQDDGSPGDIVVVVGQPGTFAILS